MQITKIDAETRHRLAADIMNHISEVLFYWFEEGEEDLENEDNLNEFVSFLWNISILTMGALNMKIIGTGEGKKIYVEMTPVESVKNILIEKSIGEPDEVYYEDMVEDVEKEDHYDVDFGSWEELFSLES